MNENIITVNGIDYEILFVYRNKADKLILLVSDGTDTFCTEYKMEGEKPVLLPCTDEEVAEAVGEYNEKLTSIIEWDGILYERVADISGITLAAREGDKKELYAFLPQEEGWKAMELDSAGKLFYKNMYRARLEENHEFLQSATPITAPASRAREENRLCALGDYGVYLLHESDSVPNLLFVDEKNARAVVSPAKQQELLAGFRAWEKQEYQEAGSFVLKNIGEARKEEK